MSDHDDDHHPTPRPVNVLSAEWAELRAHELRLAALEADRVSLYGHRGQPGVLGSMSGRLDAHERTIGKIEDRLAPLERLRWQVVGASVLAGSIVSVIVLLVSKLWR